LPKIEPRRVTREWLRRQAYEYAMRMRASGAGGLP
jgi:hypothetical protein